MKVVIQCAASKREGAGMMERRNGAKVKFVADPALAPHANGVVYARPDDPAEYGSTWRDEVLEYNRSPGSNPLGLLRASELYTEDVYQLLASRFGVDNLFILSAGWGLIPADFLTPNYDITFSSGKKIASYKRRKKADPYQDLCLFPSDSDEPVVFLGGKDYVPKFVSLTAEAKGLRVIFYNAKDEPKAPGCTLVRFYPKKPGTRTNWQYECARALMDGGIGLPAALM